jgi:glycosyltransferase involved in cell wall biosynthesis
MKIAVINSIYKPDTRGGAEVAVENIVTGLKSQGHDVFVLSVGRKRYQESVDGTKVYRIRPLNFFNFLDINSKPTWLRMFWHPLDMLSDFQTWQVYKALKEEAPDLVLTHNLKGLGYYIPWLVSIMKIAHVHTVHDMQLIHPAGLLRDGQKLGWPVRLYTLICRKLFSPIRKVVFPSEYIKTVYNKYGFFNDIDSVVLGNPINVFKAREKKDVCSYPTLLFLGQIEEYKGILDLIVAAKQIKRNFLLQVVGDGRALPQAKELAGGDDRIVFYGRMNQQELAEKIWPNVDLLVNPTKVPESFGMVVAEACAHGIPSLSADIGALPEIIDNGKTGWLFKAGDQTSLLEQLDVISGHICTYGSIGLLCQQSVKKFATDSYLNKLGEFANIKKS